VYEKWYLLPGQIRIILLVEFPDVDEFHGFEFGDLNSSRVSARG
jgi:hypothetical protein